MAPDSRAEHGRDGLAVPPDTNAAHRAANRWAVLADDAGEAFGYLEAIREIENTQDVLQWRAGQVVRDGLYKAAIIAYCRCFTKSFSGGKADAKADFLKLPIAGEPAMLALHLRLLDLRHKLIAHSEWSHRSNDLVSVSAAAGILRENRETQAWQGVDIELFRQLALRVSNEAVDLRIALDLSHVQCPVPGQPPPA